MTEIMLSKSFDESKIEYPVEVTIKLDGIAADFYKTPNGWLCQSRQGKPLPSTGHIVLWLNEYLPDAEVNTHIIGELTVTGVESFKDAGGIIRRQETDDRIVLNAYDMYVVGRENEPYGQRKAQLSSTLDKLSKDTLQASKELENTIVRVVQCVPRVGIARNKQQLEQHFSSLEHLMQQSCMFEGYVIRNLGGKHSRYGVGKRSYGMMKYKPKPTIDLRLVDFEEATANKTMKFLGEEFHKGEGLRAVGGIICEYKDGTTKVGPGCLTHEQRRTIWEAYARNGTPKDVILEVEYMLDQNYDKLRQPVFKQWRFDKTEPSYET